MMKSILTLILLTFTLFSCQESTDKKSTTNTSDSPQFFGEKITEDGAKPIDSLANMMGTQTELNCKLSGKIEAVCQKKGCWMELKNGDSSTVRVTFKDYGFFMPKDASGKTVIIDGIAKVEVTSVADLQEYAKDDKKSAEEIAAIKEPLKELVFEAKGVILK